MIPVIVEAAPTTLVIAEVVPAPVAVPEDRLRRRTLDSPIVLGTGMVSAGGVWTQVETRWLMVGISCPIMALWNGIISTNMATWLPAG